MPPYESWLVAAAFLCALLAIAARTMRLQGAFAGAAVAFFTFGATASLILKVFHS